VNPKDLVGAKKAPLKLVPPAAIIGMADGLSVGAVKYCPYNWREQPIEVMTYIEAAERHLHAFKDGQDYSEDTAAVVGHAVHHIDHALAGLGILRDALASGKVVDNRPPRGPAADLLRSMDRSTKPAVPQPVEQGETWNIPPGTGSASIVYGMPRKQWDGYEAASDQDCNCPPDWNEHAMECPLFHAVR